MNKLVPLFLALGFLFGCSSSDLPLNGPSDSESDVPVVDNPAIQRCLNPDGPRLIFDKDLDIELPGDLYSFDVDRDGKIFILDIGQGEIQAFDRSGNPFLTFGRMGEGPEEFLKPWTLSLQNGKIHVLDRSKQKIFTFDEKGQYENTTQIPSSTGLNNHFDIFSETEIILYSWRSSRKLGDSDRMKKGIMGVNFLSIYSNDFEKRRDLFSCDFLFAKIGKGNSFLPTLYPNVFCYQIDGDGNIYYGFSSKYEIYVYSPEGNLKKIIKKRADRIPTTQKDLDHILFEYPEFKNEIQQFHIFKTKPFFSNIFFVQDVGLLVCTYEDEWSPDGLLRCDLFDEEGLYIARVKIPEFYYWNHHGLITEQRNCLFKHGNCYALVFDDLDNRLRFVRYKVAYAEGTG